MRPLSAAALGTSLGLSPMELSTGEGPAVRRPLGAIAFGRLAPSTLHTSLEIKGAA